MLASPWLLCDSISASSYTVAAHTSQEWKLTRWTVPAGLCCASWLQLLYPFRAAEAREPLGPDTWPLMPAPGTELVMPWGLLGVRSVHRQQPWGSGVRTGTGHHQLKSQPRSCPSPTCMRVQRAMIHPVQPGRGRGSQLAPGAGWSWGMRP